MGTFVPPRESPARIFGPGSVLAMLVALGIAVRSWFVFAADFPLRDGGLFYLMAQEFEQNTFRAPLYTAFNFSSIPFAYPPLRSTLPRSCIASGSRRWRMSFGFCLWP